jgi:predicted PurR-regulated permease PerM
MLKAEKYDVDRIFRFILALIAAAIFFSLIYYLRTILIPFVIAFIIAYLLDPVVDLYEGMKIPRVLSILIVFLLIGCILFSIIFGVTPYIYYELVTFGEIVPSYISKFYEFIQSILSKYDVFSENNPLKPTDVNIDTNIADISDYAVLDTIDTNKNIANEQGISEKINTNLNRIFKIIEPSKLVEQLVSYISDIFSQILNIIYMIVAFVIIIMYVFFLLRDIDKFKERWIYYVPEKYRKNVKLFVNETYFYISNFFRGQLLIVSILSILFIIGFSIVGIPMPIILGLTAGFLNLIPNFGTLIATFPAVLLAVGQALQPGGGDPLLKVVAVLIVFIVVQVIQDTVLVPTIMGKRTGLRPATILFSILIWGKLLGFLGIILAIPLTCMTKVYFARFVLKREHEKIAAESGN